MSDYTTCPDRVRVFRHGYAQVFVDSEAQIRILSIIQIKDETFVKCLKADAVCAIYQRSLEDILKTRPSLLGEPDHHYLWPYERYREKFNSEWEWLGELE